VYQVFITTSGSEADINYINDQSHWDFIWEAFVFSHVMLRVSECLNPIFYNISSR